MSSIPFSARTVWFGLVLRRFQEQPVAYETAQSPERWRMKATLSSSHDAPKVQRGGAALIIQTRDTLKICKSLILQLLCLRRNLDQNVVEWSPFVCGEQLDAEDWEVWHNRGLCYLHAKQFDQALESFERANAVSRHDSTYLHMGKVSRRENRRFREEPPTKLAHANYDREAATTWNATKIKRLLPSNSVYDLLNISSHAKDSCATLPRSQAKPILC